MLVLLNMVGWTPSEAVLRVTDGYAGIRLLFLLLEFISCIYESGNIFYSIIVDFSKIRKI